MVNGRTAPRSVICAQRTRRPAGRCHGLTERLHANTDTVPLAQAWWSGVSVRSGRGFTGRARALPDPRRPISPTGASTTSARPGHRSLPGRLPAPKPSGSPTQMHGKLGPQKGGTWRASGALYEDADLRSFPASNHELRRISGRVATRPRFVPAILHPLSNLRGSELWASGPESWR